MNIGDEVTHKLDGRRMIVCDKPIDPNKETVWVRYVDEYGSYNTLDVHIKELNKGGG